MDILLVILALIGAVVGLLSLSQATLGVGILAGACLLAILARMVQAHHHHSGVMKALAPGQQPFVDKWAPESSAWSCELCRKFNHPQADTCAHCGADRPRAVTDGP